jgi:hypothetical protein
MSEEVQSGDYTVTAQLRVVTKPGGQLPCRRQIATLFKALLTSPPAQFTDVEWDVHDVEIMTQWVSWEEEKKEKEVDGP